MKYWLSILNVNPGIGYPNHPAVGKAMSLGLAKCQKRSHLEIVISHLKWLTNKDLLYSTGNSAQYSVTT